MKRIISFSVITALLVVLFTLINSTPNEVEYEVYQGNSLTEQVYSLTSYVTQNQELKTYDFDIPENFILKSQNDYLELYVEESSLAIIVRVKANGYIYGSYNVYDTTIDNLNDSVRSQVKSGIGIDVYHKWGTPSTINYMDKNPANDDAPFATSEIVDTSNGCIFEVNFIDPTIKIKFNVVLELDDDDLVVSIPRESINEYNANLWTTEHDVQYHLLRNITVFPYFGSIEQSDSGYAVIPDGSGMIIDFKEDPENKAVFNLELYGKDLGYMDPFTNVRISTVKDLQRITLPIYGMIHEESNTGFYTISESGNTYATLEYSSAGIITDYHRAYFSYTYRDSYKQYQSRANEDQSSTQFQKEPNIYDMQQRYCFLEGDEASYVGLAKDYREYLISNDSLNTSATLNIEETYPTKFDFIGTEITLGILNNVETGISSYNSIKNTIDLILESDITNVNVALKNYSMSDHGYRFGVYNSLGGSEEFVELLDYLNEQNIPFNYYLDYVRSYKDYSTKHAQTLSRKEIYHIEYSYIYIAHVVNETTEYKSYAEEDIENLLEYGINNVSLAGLDRAIFTSYDSGIRPSYYKIDDINDMLDLFNDSGINTNVYLPDDFTFSYVNEYYNAPLSSTGYSAQSSAIPLLQLILSGEMDLYSDYLNFISDESFTLLRLVEYGVYPSYTLTTTSAYELTKTNASNVYISEYDVMKNRMALYNDFIEEGLNATIGATMINHELIDVGVSRVTYDNGIVIVCNYNSNEFHYDDLTIPSLDYVVISYE